MSGYDMQQEEHAGQRAGSLDLSIEDLELRTRAENVLLDASIFTVGDALAALEEGGDEALLDIKGFGPKSLADLKEQLRQRDFRLPAGRAPSPEGAASAQGEAREKEPTEESIQASSRTATTLAPEIPSFGQRLRATFAQAAERIEPEPMVYGLVSLLIIVALLLPPLSLLRQFSIVGYTSLNAANSSVSQPDGITVQVDPQTFDGGLRVRLESVSRLQFLEGSAGSALRKAAKALPPHLIVKSPYYKIRARGDPAHPVFIDVVVPSQAEPWETLDLYTWTGEGWEWLGSDLHTEVAEHEFIRAKVTEMPRSVVVVQAKPITSTVAAYVESSDELTDVDMFDKVNPTGLLLGTMGGFAGNPEPLPRSIEAVDCGVLPTLRNWAPGKGINSGLLSDLLAQPEIQKAHIDNIVQMCKKKGFDGIEIDYRGVAPEERGAYGAFVSALAEALHDEELQLALTVEHPTPIDGGWDTGGYDWAALGAAADAVKVPFPANPAAYVEGGEAQRLFDWATARIPRYKLRMLVSSLSALSISDSKSSPQSRGETSSAANLWASRYVSYEKALAPFGEITVLNGADQVEPGAQVTFGLSGPLLGITPQEGVGTYRLKYRADDGTTHTVWPGTAASLAAKLLWASNYHLGGIAVTDAFDPGNAEGALDVVTKYPAVGSPPNREMEVVWIIVQEGETIGQRTSPLTDPSYTWTAPDRAGTYTIEASIAGFAHGSVRVTVAESQSVATETETMTTTERTGTEGSVTGECLDAAYVADVTIPDDTQLDNGETFEKTWRVRNSGTCAWPRDAVLAFVGGDRMEAPESVEVDGAKPGGNVDISVRMKAPAEDGSYTGRWRMKVGETFFGGELWVAIQTGAGAQAAPVPSPSGGGGFELGGHINDWGFPHADKMHHAGMNWAKVQVHYGDDASGIIRAAHANGFKIQLSALGTADMVTQPGFEQEFADWAAGMAAGGADAIEVWNEPNIEREWQKGYISAQAYTNLLCTAYEAIKAVNSGTAVISAAPAPTGFFGGCSPNGCDDRPWLQQMYNAGAAQCMDYIGAHHNAGATSPSATTGHPGDSGGHHHSWYFLPQTELYYNTFNGARKLFYTEMGYASQEGVPPFSEQFAWARGTDNAEQAAWLKEAAQLSINTGMVRCIIVWNVDFPRYGSDPQDGFAIIRPNGSCPACGTLHSLLGTR